MSARISYMYRTSGGCDKEHLCEKCGYFLNDNKNGLVTERCRLHESMTGEEHVWNGNWMACKHYQQKGRSGKMPKYKPDRFGQMCMTFN